MSYGKTLLMTIGLLAMVGSVFGAPTQWSGNGHYYELVDAGGAIAWTAVRDAAAGSTYEIKPGVFANGHLATVTSAAEDTWVADNLLPPVNTYSGAWLGGFQDPTATEVDEGWGWTTGEPWSYTDWDLRPSRPEPDDGHFDYVEDHDQDYLQYRGDYHGYWDDLQGEPGAVLYLVEYVPEPAALMLLAVGGLAVISSRRRRWIRAD